jgi:hypothetical protein
MSVISQQVFAAPGQVFSTISGGGGGGAISSISNGSQSVECGAVDITLNSGNQVNINGVAVSLNGSSWSVNPGIFSTVALECSSINGAAPGGGGATVSTFTDLTVNNPIALGATLNLRADDVDLYTIGCVSSSVTLAALSLGLTGGRNQVYTEVLEAPALYTSTITGTTGVISLNPNGTDQIVIGGNGAPGDIRIATVGGGNINIQGPTNVTSGLFNVPGTGSISSLTASSINGSVYPPPATSLPSTYVNGVMSNFFQGSSSGGGTMFDLQDPFPTAFTYAVDNWITINGNAQAIIDFAGNGNTNNLVDSNGGSQPAHLDMSLYWDNNDNNFQQFVISAWDSTAALSGSFGPTTTIANSQTRFDALPFPGSYTFYQNPLGGAQIFSATLFGKRNVKLKTNANIFLNSGDPTENYTLTIRAPYIDSANTAVFNVNQG